jgi:DNA-binding LacI/PurR family transcriptional regulator
MSDKIITIKDVAKLAGVSLGTVSNVVNGLGSVKKENREKVLKAMEELKYIPNLTAQTLKTNKSKTLGLILPTIANPFYPAVAKGIEDIANRMGYTVVLCNSDRGTVKEEQYIEMLISTRAAGVIIIKSRLTEEQLNYYSGKISITLVDSRAEMTGNLDRIDMIEAENYEGSFKAVEYLQYNLNHSKIAYISGDLSAKSDFDRLNGYKDAMKAGGIELNEKYIKKGDFKWESGYDHAIELLTMKDKPTAICCGNDMTAVGVMKAARKLEIDVPRELSVIGFDDIDLCELTMPPLTTVKHPKYEQGEKAARVLLDKIKNKENHMVKNYVLSTELKVRESTAKCYKDHE